MKKKLGKLVVGLVVLLVLALAYYYTEGTNDTVENTVAVVLEKPFPEGHDNLLAKSFARYAPLDSREDISLLVYQLPEDEAELFVLAQTLEDCAANLYLMDAVAQEKLMEHLSLTDLSSRYPIEQMDLDVFYRLDGTEFLSVSGLTLPEGSGIALRASDSYMVTKNAQAREYYEYQSNILDNIAKDRE